MEEDTNLIEMEFWEGTEHVATRFFGKLPLKGDWVVFGGEIYEILDRLWSFNSKQPKMIYGMKEIKELR
jgi:hypothetical protein